MRSRSLVSCRARCSSSLLADVATSIMWMLIWWVKRAAWVQEARGCGEFRHGDTSTDARIRCWQGCHDRPQAVRLCAGEVATGVHRQGDCVLARLPRSSTGKAIVCWQGCHGCPQMRGCCAGKVATAGIVRLSIDITRTQPHNPSARWRFVRRDLPSEAPRSSGDRAGSTRRQSPRSCHAQRATPHSRPVQEGCPLGRM